MRVKRAVQAVLVLLFFALVGAARSTSDTEVINDTIRRNDLGGLRRLVRAREAANVVNGLKSTPLHYAALYGSQKAIEILLAAGADPNAQNQSGATPLIYAAWSLGRTRLLVDHGAAVNVATKAGITPLLVASAAQNNADTVRYLLDHGADVKAKTKDGEDSLMRAAFSGDSDTLRVLLKYGADVKRTDDSGSTALQNAMSFADARRVRLLLDAGADVNAANTFAGMVKNGPIALTHMTPLMFAAPYSDQETIAILLKAGARVNDKDSRGMTPLMLSIATDHAQLETVRKLLAAGADVHAADIYGQTALDWARKYGNPEITAAISAAGAEGHPETPVSVVSEADRRSPGESAAQSLALLNKSDFFRAGGGCAGCHHQPAYARAYAAAQAANIPANPALRISYDDAIVAVRPRLANALPYLSSFGGDFDVPLTLLPASADLGEPPTEFTDMMIHFVAERQDTSGGWIGFGIARSPLQESTIGRTATAIEVLKRYGWPARQKEFDKRIQNAGKWLQQGQPETTYEQADRIRGLYAAGSSVSDLQASGKRLLALQREDGGWPQTPYLEPDAYATGLVLDTLFRTGLLKASDEPYRRGVAYLLRTQSAEGAWHVRSRAPKFQPYFQSGFPFQHDQWISSIGTAWAVMALSHAAETTNTVATR